jgi:tetratricopeptide (TPR) repeat protein
MGTAEGGRYRFHDLVRLYAQQRMDEEDPVQTITAVRRQMAAWLLDTLTAAGQWFEPGGAQTGFARAEDADEWIRIESEHWLPALGEAALAGDDAVVVRAVGALHWFSDRWVDWPRWAEVFMLGHDSAERLGDRSKQAEFLNYVAWTYTLPWRDKRPAVAYAERSLELARAAGDVLQEAWALEYTARAQRILGDLATAMTAAQRAAELFEQLGDVDAGCQTWLLRGDILFRLGHADEALANYQHALEMVEDPAAGMTATIAEYTRPQVLIHIGRALGKTGRATQGIATLQRALDLLDRGHRPLEQAIALQVLAELYGDDHDAVRDSLLRAADLYESAGLLEQASEFRAKAAGHESAGSS